MNAHSIPPPARATITPGLTILLAAASGVCVANLYYAQPLAGLIGPDVGLPPDAAGLVVTLAQLGYAVGLVLLVPLGDRLENRRLIVATVLATALALLGMAAATSGPTLLAAATILGITSVVTQMLIPFAAHLAPAATRGQVVGNVMSGLVIGILLARPVASFVAYLANWRAVFGGASVLMVLLAVCLARALPIRKPEGRESYGAIIRSMGPLLLTTPSLQRRIGYQAAMFAGFSLFWTAVPFWLSEPPFSFTQRGIALFALAGAAGALVSPFAGRAADRGHGRAVTGLAVALAAVSFGVGYVGRDSVAALAIAAILIDSAVQLSLVVGQRTIFSLDPGSRSRLNGIFMASFFLAAALASSLASPVFHRAGWAGICAVGLLFPAAAALLFLTEFRRPKPAPDRTSD